MGDYHDCHGLSLWWPTTARGIGGVLYPRLGRGPRAFWRDLHGVTGFWISAFALFLLLTGLPWAKVWGEYFQEVRRLTGTDVRQQDWTVGATRQNSAEAPLGPHAEHGGPSADASRIADLSPGHSVLDRLVSTVRRFNLSPPVLLSPPSSLEGKWTAKSDTQNRPLRVNLVLDETTGVIVQREDFRDRHLLDRAVGIGVAAHEGQLFGWPNQVLGLLTASGLLILVLSSVNMWWRLREDGVLGAPAALQTPRFLLALVLLVGLFFIYLPLFAASLIIVLVVERFALRRIPVVATWLGLTRA